MVGVVHIPILLQLYDPDKSTAIVGMFSVGLGVAALFAPPIATSVVAATGSFTPVILLTVGAAFLAIVFLVAGMRS